MALTELRSAALCVFVAWALWKNYPVRIYALAACAWFSGQAIDEWTAHNLWGDGVWEYPIFLLYGTLIYLHLRSHDSGKAKQD